MAIVELYSQRQKKLRGEVSDVYQYTDFPKKLRVQIWQLIKEALGSQTQYPSYTFFSHFHGILCREYGVERLSSSFGDNQEDINRFITKESTHEQCLDVIELVFTTISDYVRDFEKFVEELNYRFRQSGVGYQFEGNEIIRVDSQFIHSEAVIPTLQILGNNPSYQGANDEFLSAHEHYRHQQYKECLNDCLKAFESLMKAIHVNRGWELNPTDPAKKLINGCLTNGLIPEYMQNEFSSLRILLESGIPTIRNKEAGHGQGHEVTTVPEHLASYALHLTASTLLFLAKCDENL